jgi:hypothetical protein
MVAYTSGQLYAYPSQVVAQVDYAYPSQVVAQVDSTEWGTFNTSLQICATHLNSRPGRKANLRVFATSGKLFCNDEEGLYNFASPTHQSDEGLLEGQMSLRIPGIWRWFDDFFFWCDELMSMLDP